ncbi:unnamed protein product [Sympodiomycopsis kandeliae]
MPTFDPSSYPATLKSAVSPVEAPLVQVSLAPEQAAAGSKAPIFIVTFLAAQTPDNRLTPQFLTALLSALEHIESVWDNREGTVLEQNGAAVVLTGLNRATNPDTEASNKGLKFFSNGLDFANAIADPDFFDKFLFPVYEKLLTFPVPTVASIGGHAFAAGFGLASAADYGVMGDRGFLCMNEIDFGAQIPPGLYAPLSTRIAHNPVMLRKIILEGQRISAAEAKQNDIIDVHLQGATTPEEVLKSSIELANKWVGKSVKGVWGENRRIIVTPQLQILRETYAQTLSKL